MLNKNINDIALWACPRSCSTLMVRSFEQRADCLVFDEPFYAAYLLNNGFNNADREVMMAELEVDYRKVIQSLRKDLPANKKIRFQKHHPKNILPHFGNSWLPSKHIFLLRHPKDIILSYKKCVDGPITTDDVAIEALYHFFQKIKSVKENNFLVIHSDDLLKEPEQVLRKICDTFNMPFCKSMLSWEKGLKNSSLMFTGNLLPYADRWYGSVKDSTGFKPYRKKDVAFPVELEPLLEPCMDFYEKLLPLCVKFTLETTHK